jgi:hypothetical protein
VNDKQQNELLEKFINDSPLATGIQVTVTQHHKSFKPRLPSSVAHYEDCNLLSAILMGAENLVYWLRRNEYTITTKRKKVAKVDYPKGYKKSKKTKKLSHYMNPDGN